MNYIFSFSLFFPFWFVVEENDTILSVNRTFLISLSQLIGKKLEKKIFVGNICFVKIHNKEQNTHKVKLSRNNFASLKVSLLLKEIFFRITPKKNNSIYKIFIQVKFLYDDNVLLKIPWWYIFILKFDIYILCNYNN